MRANLQLLAVSTEVLEPRVSRRDYGVESLTWYREWHEGLGDDRRAGLACVASQTAGYLAPTLDRPAVLEASSLWETVLVYDWLDAELHELARQAQLRHEQLEPVAPAAHALASSA